MTSISISDFANKNPQEIQSKIDLIRLEIEHLRLENEKLRLLNDNHILRTQSQERIVEIPIEDDFTEVPSLEEEDKEIDQEECYDEVLKHNYTGSKILSCEISNSNTTVVVEGKNLNYTRIARNIWELTPRQIIYDKSTFNSKDYHCSKHGYKWIYEIQLSMQIGNTREVLNEIIHMCRIMKFKLDMKIEMADTSIVDIKIGDDLIFKRSQPKQVLTTDRLLYSNTFYGW